MIAKHAQGPGIFVYMAQLERNKQLLHVADSSGQTERIWQQQQLAHLRNTELQRYGCNAANFFNRNFNDEAFFGYSLEQEKK